MPTRNRSQKGMGTELSRAGAITLKGRGILRGPKRPGKERVRRIKDEPGRLKRAPRGGDSTLKPLPRGGGGFTVVL